MFEKVQKSFWKALLIDGILCGLIAGGGIGIFISIHLFALGEVNTTLLIAILTVISVYAFLGVVLGIMVAKKNYSLLHIHSFNKEYITNEFLPKLIKTRSPYGKFFLPAIVKRLTNNEYLTIDDLMRKITDYLKDYYLILGRSPEWDEIQSLALTLISPFSKDHNEVEVRIKEWIRDRKREEIEIT